MKVTNNKRKIQRIRKTKVLHKLIQQRPIIKIMKVRKRRNNSRYKIKQIHKVQKHQINNPQHKTKQIH